MLLSLCAFKNSERIISVKAEKDPCLPSFLPLASCSLSLLKLFLQLCVAVCLPLEPWVTGSCPRGTGRWQKLFFLTVVLLHSLCSMTASRRVVPGQRGFEHPLAPRPPAPYPCTPSRLSHLLFWSPRNTTLCAALLGSRLWFASGGEGSGKAVVLRKGWLKKVCYSVVYCF